MDEQGDLRLPPPPRLFAFGRKEHPRLAGGRAQGGRIGRGSFVAVVLLAQLSWLGTLGYLVFRLL